MFVFGKDKIQWFGTFDFRFEQMVVSNSLTYGIKNREVYQLNIGYIINGSPIVFEVSSGAAPEQMWDKEFARVRINTINALKPSRVEFYKAPDGVVQCALDPSQGALYMKNYRGYEQFIPRINASVSAKRPRLQGRLLIFKIIHTLASEFTVIDATIFYKTLK